MNEIFIAFHFIRFVERPTVKHKEYCTDVENDTVWINIFTL